MSLTRKHFVELARIVREEKEGTNAFTLRSELADFCARHNTNFDRQRFLDACESSDEVTR